MGKMYRIALQSMLVLLRLVIVTSLAGYSLPTASAAMHGSWANSGKQAADHHAQPDVLDELASADHSHGDHPSSTDEDQKVVKQDCCKDFCASIAILGGTSGGGGPRVVSIREFIDDARALGQFPSLHRPPNI